ncbi:DUF1127 domain-containing protein [Celerinatantimonas yamalensis]|uniref:DUF1127 domain-containing protein n=1 Tax=Celerinatantimonas yamalensis TaxID=559956 RepID=A0ABW9G1E5_9GAMM
MSIIRDFNYAYPIKQLYELFIHMREQRKIARQRRRTCQQLAKLSPQLRQDIGVTPANLITQQREAHHADAPPKTTADSSQRCTQSKQ